MERFEADKMSELKMKEQELDRMLESDGGLQIRQAVQSMPEDHVSMAWRSQLNERLSTVVAVKQRKRRFAWILSPALGLGLAGALAVVVMTKTPTHFDVPDVRANTKLEESLVASHRDILQYSDITGVGLNTDEVVSKRSSNASYSYDEVDFGSL